MAMEQALKEYFGFTKFRPFQKEIINKLLGKHDCLVVMATGSGKSICYQLPPLISKKPAVVISPLISLMQDQVMGLKQRGINAEYLSSAQTNSSVFSKAKAAEYDVLFMTPERSLSLPDSFWTGLVNKGLSLLAVDEAHCISEWGHDFRKEYQQLHKLRRVLSKTPFVALTATATKRVRDDIKESLQMEDVYEVVSTFDRPNIFYGVKFINRTHTFREELAHEVMKDCQSGGSTIIYCTTIRDVEEVTQALVGAGVDARSYHGQMNLKSREDVHRAFAHDELQIVVATVAFGMGIDKPDIRRVIHYGCPKSLESYYQESGRCGRDGLPSTCWLYYTRADFNKADYYTAEADTKSRKKAVLDAYQSAEKYCKTSGCRRKFVLEYFGEMTSYENCGKCDNCTKSEAVKTRDMSEEVHLLLSSIELCGGRFGINMPIDVLRGSRSKKVLDNKFDELPLYGLGSCKSANWWKSLGDDLLSMGYLVETRRDIYRFVSVGTLGRQFLQAASAHRPPIMMIPNQEMLEEEAKKCSSHVEHKLDTRVTDDKAVKHHMDMTMSELEFKLYESLLKERANLAKKNLTAPYAICSESTIQNLAKIRPSSKARLINIDGVNQWLVKKHGEEVLSVIKEVCCDLGLPLDSVEKPVVVDSQKLPNAPNEGYEVKATPAKIEAWRMWQEMGMPMSKIANLPDRPKPVKEETIADYIIQCCRLGYKLDWERFCSETGFDKVVKEVQSGVELAGCRDKLKQIKEQVPEHVSYLHIKMFLMMEDLNLPYPNVMETDAKNHELDEQPVDTQEVLKEDNEGNDNKTDDDSSKPPWLDTENSSKQNKQRRAPIWRESQHETLSSNYKRIRHEEGKCERESVSSVEKVPFTAETLLDWLSKKDGVSTEEILSSFCTDESSLMEALAKLEGDFLIYRKNGIYNVI